jgi:hypothetical protein
VTVISIPKWCKPVEVFDRWDGKPSAEFPRKSLAAARFGAETKLTVRVQNRILDPPSHAVAGSSHRRNRLDLLDVRREQMLAAHDLTDAN